MEGYFSAYRRLLESPLWLSEKFTRGQAWIDLFGLANHQDGFIRVRGIKVDIKRGQIGWSEERLSKRWKWSRTKVRNFLKELENEQQIKQQKNNVTLLLSICNYEKYQNKNSRKDNKRTAEEHQKDTNKNDKNEKNNISVIFEEFRKAFPGTKRGLNTELKNFLKNNNPELVHLLLPALENEKQHRDSCERQKEFIPPWAMMSTWINQKRWEQEFNPPITNNSQSQKTPAEWLQ